MLLLPIPWTWTTSTPILDVRATLASTLTSIDLLFLCLRRMQTPKEQTTSLVQSPCINEMQINPRVYLTRRRLDTPRRAYRLPPTLHLLPRIESRHSSLVDLVALPEAQAALRGRTGVEPAQTRRACPCPSPTGISAPLLHTSPSPGLIFPASSLPLLPPPHSLLASILSPSPSTLTDPHATPRPPAPSHTVLEPKYSPAGAV
ncbi:hypothetical protein B0H12DRAFT_1231718 [Mycena haematopus]|nr:hypothetical protein B0H12DRAFT_1231718 [Mycena haematopus]